MDRERIPQATERRSDAARVREHTGLRYPGNLETDGSHYTKDELEFMFAVAKWKREHNRPFPSWSEVFSVVLALGYRKVEG